MFVARCFRLELPVGVLGVLLGLLLGLFFWCRCVVCAAAFFSGLCDLGCGFCWLFVVLGLGGPRLGASSAG